MEPASTDTPRGQDFHVVVGEKSVFLRQTMTSAGAGDACWKCVAKAILVALKPKPKPEARPHPGPLPQGEGVKADA